MKSGRKHIIKPAGNQKDIKLRSCAAILPVDSKGRIFLVRQRHRKQLRVFLEVPMGGLRGEYSLDRAKSKLEEKLSLKAKNWFYLGKAYEIKDYANMLVYLYLATNVYPVDAFCQKNKKSNGYQIENYSLRRIERLIRENIISDLITIVLFYKTLSSLGTLPRLKGLGKVDRTL